MELASRSGELEAAGAQIVAVGTEDAGTVRGMVDEWELPYLVLADPERAVSEMYGVKLPPDSEYCQGSFLIDQRGIVRDRFLGQYFPVEKFLGALRAVE